MISALRHVYQYGAGGRYGGGSRSPEPVYKPCPICNKREVEQPRRPKPETALDKIEEALNRPACWDCQSVARDVRDFFRVLMTLSVAPEGLWVEDLRKQAEIYESLRAKAQEKAEQEQRSADHWAALRDAHTL